MRRLEDFYHRHIDLTGERQRHIENDHPEMAGQIEKIKQTLLEPEQIVRSRIDPEVELFYRYYDNTPVSEKYLCVVLKTLIDRRFIITAYFTDTVKEGDVLWEKR